MRRMVAISLACLVWASFGVAHAQALKDNLPIGDPVFEGELRPITEPIRLRYVDTPPIETVFEIVLVFGQGAVLEGAFVRAIYDVTSGATRLNIDIMEARER